MEMKTLISILLISECFYLCIINSCPQQGTARGGVINPTDAFAMIHDGLGMLKEGDLVVRLNRDATSQFIKNFNRLDKSYSHAGIVFFENGYPYVYHIVNGEENPGEKLRKDSLSRFCNPRRNNAFGIFRYSLEPGEIQCLKHIYHNWYTKGVAFDSAFDLSTNNRMYCSEMIDKALATATKKRITIETTAVTATEARAFSIYMHLPMSYTSKLRIVSIDNLYENPYCHSIREYKF